MIKLSNEDINSPQAVSARWFRYNKNLDRDLQRALWHGRTLEEELLRRVCAGVRVPFGASDADMLWELERRGYAKIDLSAGSDDGSKLVITTLGSARIVELMPVARL